MYKLKKNLFYILLNKLFVSFIFYLLIFNVFDRIIYAQNFYFGDLHVHSNLSDGLVHPQNIYNYAKNVSKIDFICITDHDIYPSDNRNKWELMKYYANLNNQNNYFISFIGYEYTNWLNGHRTIIYGDNEGGFHSAGNVDISSITRLVHEDGGIVNIAHPNIIPFSSPVTSLDGHQEDNIELLTDYRYEFFNNPNAPVAQLIGSSVQDWLINKKVLGFIGATDSHVGEPGKYGLTGVYCDSLTRKSIFSAIKKRHIFATTGQKIKLLFSTGKYIMGDLLTQNQKTNNEFELNIIGTSKIKMVEIIKNNQLLVTFLPDTISFKTKFSDVFDSVYCYYYLRVTQEDGGMAWSSPIFFQDQLNILSLIEKENEQPTDFFLYQNYPNPFNSSTNFVFETYKEGYVVLRIYDLLGRKIDTILDKYLVKGLHKFIYNTKNLAGGSYFYELSISDGDDLVRSVKKMLIIK